MFTKLTKHRQFEYTPRRYNPDKEKKERPQIQFQNLRSRQKGRSFVWLLIMVAFIVFLLFALSRISNYF